LLSHQRAEQARWDIFAVVMFLLIWGLSNRDETFYSALKTKWAILRKALELQGRSLDATPVSAPALSQARLAAGSNPFDTLLKTGNKKHLENHDSLTRFKGYRLFATDGSSLNLHSNTVLESGFDRPHSTGKSKALPQASFTTLQLVDTGWIVDFRVGKCDDSELHQTIDLAQSLVKGDLILGDRLSFDTKWFSDLDFKGVKFLFRSTSTRYKSFTKKSKELVKKQKEQGNVDCIVELKIKGSSSNTVKVRYVEVVRKGQETLRFITNVPLVEFNLKEIETLYRLRWEIETEFRIFKGQNHLPVILSRTEETVRQEIGARIIAHNTVRYVQAEACIEVTSSNTCNTDNSTCHDCKPEEQLVRLDTTQIGTNKKWFKKSEVWPTMPLRPVDLQFNETVACISAYIVNTAIYTPLSPEKEWSALLREIAKAEIMVQDGRSFYRKGKQYNKGKRNKGNTKRQRKNRKKRKEEVIARET
jgi:hypothetical protein